MPVLPAYAGEEEGDEPEEIVITDLRSGDVLEPVIRFLILRNHSAVHLAYTYRALMGSVFAYGLMLESWCDFSLFQQNRKKK